MERIAVEPEDRLDAPPPREPQHPPRHWSLPPWAIRARDAVLGWWEAFQQWLFRLGGRALLAALGVIILGVLVNALVAFVSIHTITDRDGWVVHTQVVQSQIAQVQSDLVDAQTGARGYVITGDQSYLRPYTTAKNALDGDLRTLQTLTADNGTQLARIRTLRAQIPPEIAELQSWIDLRSAGRTAEADASVSTGNDQRQMIAIRAILHDMQTTENNLLHVRDASAQTAVQAAVISVALAVLVDLALLFIIYTVLRRALQIREAAVAESAQAQARVRLIGLQEANRRMEEFLGVAGHELRTPLTSALANVQIAERQARRMRDGTASNVEQFERLLTATEGQLRRQSRLVDDLLDVTRIESGKLQFRPEEFDLVALVRRSVEEQQRLSSDREITFLAPANSAEAPVIADPDRISQVLTNYLTNALKYSPKTAPVEVEVSLRDLTARVSVRDGGPGVVSEERERVWERFHRTEGIEVQSGSGVGLGLGLFISKTFIERHNGSVGVDARSDRKPGSDFWFTLPLAKESGAPTVTLTGERAE